MDQNTNIISASETAVSTDSGLNTINSLTATQPLASSNTLPLDSGHTAISGITDRLIDFLIVGGPVVWILLAMSIVAVSIVLIKFLQFFIVKPERVSAINASLTKWQQGKYELAEGLLNQKYSVEYVALTAMKALNSKNMSDTMLREELGRIATLKLNDLRSYLRPLELIATLSPLLGLLGTVLGMVVAFQQMEAAGNQVDPSVLSGGIWQALLTTAVGLSVAIPVVVAHTWAERKVERVSALMNDAITQIFTHKPATVKAVKTSKELSNVA
jgi:biopolymer transport protein ExbB